MKKFIVKSLYYVADSFSRMAIMEFEFGYHLYNWMMVKSSDLDEKWKIGFWKQQIKKMLNERFKRNLQDSYLTEDEKISKSIETEELMKGKKAQLGEIREWNGKKMQKTVTGWIPAGAGKNPDKATQQDNERAKKLEKLISGLQDGGILDDEGVERLAEHQKEYEEITGKEFKSGKGKESKMEGEGSKDKLKENYPNWLVDQHFNEFNEKFLSEYKETIEKYGLNGAFESFLIKEGYGDKPDPNWQSPT